MNSKLLGACLLWLALGVQFAPLVAPSHKALIGFTGFLGATISIIGMRLILIRTVPLVLALVLLASPVGAEQLATVITGDWDFYEWAVPVNQVSIDPEGYSVARQWIPFGPEFVGVEVPFTSDIMPWAYWGETRDLQIQFFGTDGWWVTFFVSIDGPVGSTDYTFGRSVTTVDRLLPLGDAVPATYTRATWTIDGFSRTDNEEIGGFDTQLQFTGRYYIAPEPSAFVLLATCLHGLCFVRRR